MHFINELLHDDVLAVNRVQVTPYHRLNPQYRRTLTRTDYPGYEDEFFVETVVALMPDGLPALLGEHARVAAEVETLKRESGLAPDSQRVRMLEQIREFWVRAFDEILSRLDDPQLVFGGSEVLVRLDEIAQPGDQFGVMPAAKAEEWFAHDNSFVKTIGAAHVLNVDERAQAALHHLERMVNPVRKIPADLEFALEVVKLLGWRAIESPELSLELLNSVLSLRAFVGSVDSYATQEAAEQLVAEASNYLYWAVRSPDTTAILEGLLIQQVNGFVQRFRADASGGDDLAIDQQLVRILRVTNSGDSGTISPEARTALEAVYEIGREELGDAGFGDFVTDWETPNR